MPYAHPDYLVETDWLVAHLHDPDLRILECTVFRRTTDRLDDQGADFHRGDGPSPHGRPGRIATSVNIPAGDLLDPDTQAYLPAEDLRARLESAGITPSDRVITYRGGGIAACSDALALTLLGHENVAVYDASLSEWAMDVELPMEKG